MSSKTNSEHRQADFFNICEKCPPKCCTEVRPPLTSKRKRIIEDFLKENGFHVSNPFENGEYSFPRETEDGNCVFLDKATWKCQVQPVKPETCVAGPVTFDIDLKTGNIVWFLKTEKVCRLAGVLHRNEEAFEKHMKSAKHEILRLVRDLDTKSLRSILTIAEPDTFKIGEDPLDSKLIAKLKR